MTYTIPDSKIAKIEWARLRGRRDKVAGCNARLGTHGVEVAPPLAKITTNSGVSGFGWSRIAPERAREYIGRSVRQLFTSEVGVPSDYYDLEYPIWDLVARANGIPVEATAAQEIFWIEEPFHEDRVLYERLREWIDREGLSTLIADGDSSRNLLEWARAGLIDVVQYDIHSPGFSRWYRLGPELDAAGVRSAPHNWGDPFGNYAACHLSAGIENFQMAEWDDAWVPGLDFSAYTIHEGIVTVPDSPGFGIELDEEVFKPTVKENGFSVE